MLSKKYIVFALSGTLLILVNWGCNDPDQAYKDANKLTDSSKVNTPVDSTNVKKKAADSAEIHGLIPAADTINAGEMDTTIRLNAGEAFIKGHLTANKPGPKYTLTAKKGQTVIATVKSSKKGGNVRITQIQQPNGRFDGPFSDSLHYTLKTNGKLRIITGENMMSGDPYTGDFILHVRMAE